MTITEEMQITAHEKRHWVRLTYACNNRCLFCHDSVVQSGEMVPRNLLDAQISKGLEQGAKRLILSGGEPTIHPDFIKMVALGKRLGYRWVQVVTNGRMFAYKSFASSACAAGLDEATFSLHGHTAELHDRLVGVKGAFEQSIEGLHNLMSSGIGVLSVDVVLTSLNLSFLPEILDFYIERGIREFDLLWLVPFGRVWQQGRDLFVSEDQETSLILRKAVDLALAKGAVVWTNRLDPPMLEGLEDLIQDPGKIHDEVRGRRPKFQMLLDEGLELPCKQPERCELCFMRSYCEALDSVLEQKNKGIYQALSVDLSRGEKPLGPWTRSRRLYIRGVSCSKAASFVRSLSSWGGEIVCELEQMPENDPMDQDWQAATLTRVASSNGQVLEQLLSFGSVSLEIILDRYSAEWLEKNAHRFEFFPRPLFVSLRRFRDSGQVRFRGTNPVSTLLSLEGLEFTLVNLPACFAPWAKSIEEPIALEMDVFSQGDSVHLESFTDHFIKNAYSVFSTRCKSCRRKDHCAGIPINLVREFGFSLARPM